MGKCADICPVNALSLAGKCMGEKEILDIILKDREYYEKSGNIAHIDGAIGLENVFNAIVSAIGE